MTSALTARTALRAAAVALTALAAAVANGGDLAILDGIHADLAVVDRPAAEPRLGLVLREGDTGVVHQTTNAVLHIPATERFELPSGFEAFGPEGTPLWILPASQDSSVLFLGVSGAGIAPGTFAGPFQIELLRVEGPAHFFLWQFDTAGNLVVRMNSRDGLGPGDSISPSAGGHEHYFWGLNATGVTDVYLRVSNRLLATGETVESDEVRVRFGVEPYSIVEPALAATLGLPERSLGRLRARLTGSPSREYRIETSEDLRTWTPAGGITTAADGVGVVDVPAGADQLFLRAVSP